MPPSSEMKMDGSLPSAPQVRSQHLPPGSGEPGASTPTPRQGISHHGDTMRLTLLSYFASLQISNEIKSKLSVGYTKNHPSNSKQRHPRRAGPDHCHGSAKLWLFGFSGWCTGQDPAWEGAGLHPRGTDTSKSGGNCSSGSVD